MKARGAVAAGHPATAAAAQEILAEGGNAFDAVLAAVCAACAVEPILCSLGGGGFLLARRADGAPALYDFFVDTPRTRRPVSRLARAVATAMPAEGPSFGMAPAGT